MSDPDVFSALANPVRRRILELLVDGPQPAGHIAAAFSLSRPSVSEHLAVLRCVGLVSEQARGRQRLYQLDATSLEEVSRWLHPFERYWRARLDALSHTLDEECDDD